MVSSLLRKDNPCGGIHCQFQVSRLTEEKAHAVSKLNVVTRTVQERDQQWRKAQVDLENLKYEQEQQEKAGPKKVAADARKQ